MNDREINLGATVIGNKTRFTVWAPFPKAVELKLLAPSEKTVPMVHQENGYYTVEIEGVGEGDEYFFLLDGEKMRPDPASRCQPHGVHGPSKVVDPKNFIWTDGEWANPLVKDYIVYEMHVGTFTDEGTFYSAIEKLDHLCDLGITAVEVMPISSFPGTRNWGYDGVCPFAPQMSYGGPEGFKTFVNACHQKGLAVVLDVVYNHFGPEGNYLDEFGPYHTDRYHTPWGKAINYDGESSQEVRHYIIENALYWIEEYHVDALRLDAVHAIFDQSETHILKELHERFSHLPKPAYLMAESDLNDPIIIKDEKKGGYSLEVQWNDDFHHAMMAYFLGKSKGYFQDFGSISDITKALNDGYVYDGQWSKFRQKKHGKSSKDLATDKFLIFLQNHDQIANASEGKTIGVLMDDAKHRLAAMILMLAPQIPMLFMGQEWASETPFQFFTSFEDESLQRAVSEGRKKEYASLGIEKNFSDPGSVETYNASKLDWNWKNSVRSSKFFEYYKKLIEIRKSLYTGSDKPITCYAYSEVHKGLLDVHCSYNQNKKYLLICNLSNTPLDISSHCDLSKMKPIISSFREERAPLTNLLPVWSGSLYLDGN